MNSHESERDRSRENIWIANAESNKDNFKRFPFLNAEVLKELQEQL